MTSPEGKSDVLARRSGIATSQEKVLAKAKERRVPVVHPKNRYGAGMSEMAHGKESSGHCHQFARNGR